MLFSSESRSAPAEVHARANARVRIPQIEGTRSLNIAVAAGIGLAEALRQTGAERARAMEGRELRNAI